MPRRKRNTVEYVSSMPQQPDVLGLRVTKAAVKESEDGAVSDITVAGRGAVYARAMSLIVGHTVELVTAGKRKFAGRLKSVATKAGKDGVPEFQAKVRGARDLDGLVGLPVTLEDAEPELPGSTGDDDAPRRGAPATRSPDRVAAGTDGPATPSEAPGASCRCGHGWSTDRNPRRKRDGHGRKSGACYVPDCGCKAFIPPAQG